jgi:hypothetical protein
MVDVHRAHDGEVGHVQSGDLVDAQAFGQGDRGRVSGAQTATTVQISVLVE